MPSPSAQRCACVLLVLAALLNRAWAGQQVVIRVSGGRFLKAAADGSLRAERFVPTEEERFELEPRAEGHISLKAPSGRFLVAEDREARRLRADSPRAEPGDRESFCITAIEGNRVALRARGYRSFVVFTPEDTAPKAAGLSDKPGPAETAEIFYVTAMPNPIRNALSTALQGLASEELHAKQYDKTQSRKIERFIDLPAPTLGDLRRTRTHRILSLVEEYRVQARLDGPLEVEITQMPLLKGYMDQGVGLLMFAVRARVPCAGRVSYRIPGALSASTGFRTVARLAMVGEVRMHKWGDRLWLSSPELREVHIELDRLQLSNDLLDLAREPIERLVNQELARNHERIRQQANRALAKAVQSRQFQHPLLRYLGIP